MTEIYCKLRQLKITTEFDTAANQIEPIELTAKVDNHNEEVK